MNEVKEKSFKGEALTSVEILDEECKYLIKVVCWHCGKVKEVWCRAPQLSFGFELIEVAKAVGMIGVIDWERSRVLVFCDEGCMRAELRKCGGFRLRAKGISR